MYIFSVEVLCLSNEQLADWRSRLYSHTERVLFCLDYYIRFVILWQQAGIQAIIPTVLQCLSGSTSHVILDVFSLSWLREELAPGGSTLNIPVFSVLS